MTDLHDWITRQVDAVEGDAHEASQGPWWVERPAANWGEERDPELASSSGSLAMFDVGENGGLNVQHAARHDPTAVLRRCEADRRILARHTLATEWEWAHEAPCHGCGVMGDCDDPVTENINNCPELLDLGYAHGLTDEILASFDRPQMPPRPMVRPLGGVLPPGIGATSAVPPALRRPDRNRKGEASA